MEFILEPEDILLPDEPEDQETHRCTMKIWCRPVYYPMYGVDI